MSGRFTPKVILLLASALVGFVALSCRSDLTPTDQVERSSNFNVFFIMIDTLRADHLGCYGYTRDTSPHLDEIAGRGILFSNFYSVSNWTTPAIASLFTGLYPREIYRPGSIEDVLKVAIPGEVDTLAEVLQSAGHRTVALIAHPMIHSQLGFAQGFSDYRMLLRDTLPLKKAPKHWIFSGAWHEHGFSVDDMTGEVSEVLDQIQDAPFFIYLHVIYPHAPYIPPSPYRDMFGELYKDVQWYSHIPREEKDGMVNAYDGEIRYTDTLVGNIFRDLETRRLLERTYLFITSDHGEAFWEHGFYEHGHYYYDEIIRIPLVIYPPGGRAEPLRIDNPTSNIDVFPTVVDVLGIEPPDGVRGESLMRFVGSEAGPSHDESVLFSERSHAADREAMAMIRGHMKYIFSPQSKQNLLFDLNTDPEEKNNLARKISDLVQEMNATLTKHREFVDARRAALQTEEQQLDEETLERIRSLGYAE